MNKRFLWLFMLLLCTGVLVFGSQVVSAATLTVGCTGSTYPTIQAAVTAANPGDTIVVCPGTYTEQVTIPVGKNNLTLRSRTPLAAIIKAPAAMLSPKAIVRVNGASNVSILAFTIAGPGGGPCDSLEYGVLVDMGGSASIRGNHITEIRDNPFGGCQNGIGIQVGRFASSQIGSASIKLNLIDKYQKGGIVISNTGSQADVSGNVVQGVGPTALIAQNGIQVSAGARANVEGNEVSDNIYTPQSVVSTGILLFEAGSVNIDHNEARRNDVNIFAFHTANPVITHNKVSDGPFDGIDLTDGTTGAIVSHNTSHNNILDGIFVDAASTNNTITHNKMSGNGLFDAEDLSAGMGSCGTANTWEHNKCDTDNQGGCLCSQGGNGNASAVTRTRLSTVAAPTSRAPSPSN